MNDGDAMTDHDIDERLRQHYSEQQLSSRRLAALREMVRSATGVDADVERASPAPVSRRRDRWISMAGVAALVLVVIALRSLPDRDEPPTAELVAQEIATNHHRNMPVEVETDAFDSLADGLDKLDFRPVSSERLDDRGLQLVGGRYCKIQGQIAAQIKLRDEAGRTWTLYECRDSELLSSVRDSRVRAMGLDVEIWREAGVLLGLAGPPD